ncbi:hypothetical protein LCGC14_2533550, partial [marine sediment metagenome]
VEMNEKKQFKPTYAEWKVEIAKAKIAHSLELYKAKIDRWRER